MIAFTPWRRALIALVGIGALALALLGGAGALSDTDAAWTDEERATASFTAGTLGPVRNLRCTDSRIVEVGLLKNQVRMDWDPPAQLPGDVPMEYRVSWREAGLLFPRSGSTTVSGTSHVVEASDSLLNLALTVTVEPLVGSWVGDAESKSALSASLAGLGLAIVCAG